jgi:hypothetical protein
MLWSFSILISIITKVSCSKYKPSIVYIIIFKILNLTNAEAIIEEKKFEILRLNLFLFIKFAWVKLIVRGRKNNGNIITKYWSYYFTSNYIHIALKIINSF